MLHEELTEVIIGAFYDVNNELGFGFLEKVYENALKLELESEGLKVEQQKSLTVYYNGSVVGVYQADLIVEDKVILELKCSEILREEHEAQLLNYLKATDIEVGLLLNFGRKPDFKRKVFSNSKKIRLTHQ